VLRLRLSVCERTVSMMLIWFSFHVQYVAAL